MKDVYSITSLHKLFILGILAFYNTACDKNYENDKNPFKSSGQCDDDTYTYSKLDLVDEEFGKIGVASSTKEYPRAGINLISTYNNGRMLYIGGTFASLCKSSIIDKVKIELHNNRGKVKTYYPDITSGYSGNIAFHINTNKDQDARCFFNKATMIFKTWARDENGNTYYAHKYSESSNFNKDSFNTGSSMGWGTKYKYSYRSEQKDMNRVTSTAYESEYKNEDKEILGISYTYKYKYRYEYLIEHKYAMSLTYKYPVEMSIFVDRNSDNDHPGEYFEMLIKIPDLDIEKRYPISNEKIQVDLAIDENFKMKMGDSYNAQISFVEKLKDCTIESKPRESYISIPYESIESVEDSKFLSTTKTLKNTIKTFVSREEKE